MIMKKIALCLLLSQLLACAALQSPMPNTLPETQQAAVTQFPNQDEYYKNQIVEPINKIVAYFDEEYELTEDVSKAHYYRLHLGNTKNGDLVVQDFYAKTKTKQCDVLIIDKTDLFKFYNLTTIKNPFYYIYTPKEQTLGLTKIDKGLGKLTIYYQNHRIFAYVKSEFNPQNEIIKATTYRPNHTIMAIEEHKETGNTTYFFDRNGIKFGKIQYDNDDAEYKDYTVYHDNGTVIFHQKNDELKMWDSNGKSFADMNAEELDSHENNIIFTQIINRIEQIEDYAERLGFERYLENQDKE